MGKVVSSASMSLDGYIAQHDNQVGRLFDWYDSGDVVVETAMPGLTFPLVTARRAVRARLDRIAGRSSWDGRSSTSPTAGVVGTPSTYPSS